MTVATSRRMLGLVSLTFTPLTVTVPSSGRSAPTRQRSTVDLPAPLRPVSATASPAWTFMEKPSTMVTGP